MISPVSPFGRMRVPDSPSTIATSTSGSGIPTDPALLMPFEWIDDARHHRFGQRIPFDDSAAGQLFELCLRRGHQRSRTGEGRANGSEVDRLAPDLWMIEQRDEQRGHRTEECRPHALNRLEQVVDVARVRHERHGRPADDRMALHADAGVHVKERQRDQRNVLLSRVARPEDAATCSAGCRRRPGRDAGRRRPSAGRSCRRSSA